jgi:hypothetical protein
MCLEHEDMLVFAQAEERQVKDRPLRWVERSILQQRNGCDDRPLAVASFDSAKVFE